MHRIAIFGPGLLGGSLALKLREIGQCEVRLWARRPDALNEIRGSAHLVSTDVGEVARDADLVVLCVPVGVMPDLARQIAAVIRPDTVVTDVGSVKSSVVADLGPIFSNRGRFVGSHPMAGTEHTGFKAAKVDLFQRATCMVTPDESTHPEAVSAATKFWESVGCRVVTIGAQEHDECVALISHLPHVVAGTIVRAVAARNPHAFQVVGPGFRDTTRVASGPPGMWVGILRENAPAVINALDGLVAQIADLRKLLADPATGDEALRNFLAEAKQTRDQIQFPT